MTHQVLHIDFISLNAEAGPDTPGILIAAAAKLAGIDEVVSAGVLQSAPDSDFDLVFWFLVPCFAALEPFGTDARYSRFLQGHVAPVLKAFSGADVQLEHDLEFVDGAAACIAVAAPDETYDWEIAAALQAWVRATAAPTSAVGLAVGERQRYRGAAIAFGGRAIDATRPSSAALTTTLARGRARQLTPEA